LLISYGDIRKFDTSHFIPLLSQLFLRGALLLVEAARCDNEAAKSVIESINSLNSISLEHYNLVNEETWLEELKKLARP
jgi:predicted ATP-grasp superfamily ATP-dependent carboligase